MVSLAEPCWPLGASVTVLRGRETVRLGPAGPQLTAHDLDGTVRLISKMDRPAEALTGSLSFRIGS